MKGHIRNTYLLIKPATSHCGWFDEVHQVPLMNYDKELYDCRLYVRM